jgi:oligopeptide transport system ATP-binding protein
MTQLLEVSDLAVRYAGRPGFFGGARGGHTAVEGVSFSVPEGESVGLVGESGSGKSSIARTVVGLQPAAAGSISYDGRRIDTARRAERRLLGREIQMVFQDPYSSLNPRLTVQQSIGVAWRAQRLQPPGGLRNAVGELLELVGLDPAVASRYPHQFSGGQRQRIGIARAIALRPRLVVCDEAVSALDVSIRAQIVNLLGDLQRELGLSYLFIAHDLSIVEHLCSRVVVLQGGRVVEQGLTADVYGSPREAYTRSLLAAIPATHPWRDAPAAPENSAKDLL